MEAHIIHFPIDRSLGKLYLSGGEPGDWVEFAEARGEIIAPCNRDLQLEFNRKQPIDLSPLAYLKPDDIQVLEVSSTHVEDHQIKYLQHLSGLRGLALWETDIGDVALSYLGKLVALRWMDIGDTKITDNGLAYLSSLSTLKELSLLNNQIGNEGLVHLSRLHRLERLDLMGTKVDDAGAKILAKLKSLRSLRICDSNISDIAYHEISEALPECVII